MKILRYFFGTIWVLFVWFMVALIVGMALVMIFPPRGGSVIVGVGLDWRNLPGTILGFFAARQSWRKHVTYKSPGSGDPKQSVTSLQPEGRFVVHVSDTEVRCERPDGRVESVAWNDLAAVMIETTDDGPMVADVFWILAGANKSSGCVIPQGATGEKALLERLQKLSGFDNKALIQAMGSTGNAKFLCWKKSPDSGVAVDAV